MSSIFSTFGYQLVVVVNKISYTVIREVNYLPQGRQLLLSFKMDKEFKIIKKTYHKQVAIQIHIIFTIYKQILHDRPVLYKL